MKYDPDYNSSPRIEQMSQHARFYDSVLSLKGFVQFSL